MKRRGRIFAAAGAVIALLGVLTYPRIDRDDWNIHLPKIEAAPASSREPAAVTRNAPVVTNGITGTERSVVKGLSSFGNATTHVSAPSTPSQRSSRDPEAVPPYWCFRTFYPGVPWLMNSDERNSGNVARSDSEYVWNGERSLKLEIVKIGEAQRGVYSVSRMQRNVLWQAIRAAPFQGKRIVFRPVLRATPGASMTAFLRSWDGSSDAPRLALDASNPANTPTMIWGGAWGSPRLLLDVPQDAKIIYYGIVQSGSLPVWIDNVEVAADSLPGAAAASLSADRQLAMGRLLEGLPSIPIDAYWIWDKPMNLDFEDLYPDPDVVVPDTPPLPC